MRGAAAKGTRCANPCGEGCPVCDAPAKGVQCAAGPRRKASSGRSGPDSAHPRPFAAILSRIERHSPARRASGGFWRDYPAHSSAFAAHPRTESRLPTGGCAPAAHPRTRAPLPPVSGRRRRPPAATSLPRPAAAGPPLAARPPAARHTPPAATSPPPAATGRTPPPAATPYIAAKPRKLATVMPIMTTRRPMKRRSTMVSDSRVLIVRPPAAPAMPKATMPTRSTGSMPERS